MLARTALCLIAFFHVTTGTGQLWIRLNSLHSNEYCDIHQGVSNSDCYLRILVCVDDSYELRNPSRCAFGRKDTGKIEGNDIQFGNMAGEIENQLTYKFNKWPGSVAIKIKVSKKDNNGEKQIDFLKTVFSQESIFNVSESSYHTLTLFSSTRLQFQIKVFCNTYYYGKECSIFCVPRADDIRGYYSCDPNTGNKVCLKGWKGSDCLEAKLYCKDTTCSNGGICLEGDNSFQCLCASGFTGITCVNDINECSSMPCRNRGTCYNTKGSYKCNCLPGYSGQDCSVVIEDCNKLACVHNSSCISDNGVSKCICKPGWIGKSCNLDLNECERSVCQNEATCTNTIGSFNCYCAQAFTGEICSEVKDCSRCSINSTCVVLKRTGQVTCECHVGYTGTLCDKLVTDNCASMGCTNNGSCIQRGDQHTCFCQPGWTGKMCNEMIDACADGSCDDHCINPNGTSSFLRSKPYDEGFKRKFVDVLNEYIKLDNPSVIDVNVSQHQIDTGRSLVNVTFEVFIDQVKLCPDHVNTLMNSFDHHDLEFLGIIPNKKLFRKKDHDWGYQHWHTAVITVCTLGVMVAAALAVCYVLRSRRRKIEGKRCGSGQYSVSFENDLDTETDHLHPEYQDSK